MNPAQSFSIYPVCFSEVFHAKNANVKGSRRICETVFYRRFLKESPSSDDVSYATVQQRYQRCVKAVFAAELSPAANIHVNSTVRPYQVHRFTLLAPRCELLRSRLGSLSAAFSRFAHFLECLCAEFTAGAVTGDFAHVVQPHRRSVYKVLLPNQYIQVGALLDYLKFKAILSVFVPGVLEIWAVVLSSAKVHPVMMPAFFAFTAHGAAYVKTASFDILDMIDPSHCVSESYNHLSVQLI
jgi:hypothetical protein